MAFAQIATRLTKARNRIMNYRFFATITAVHMLFSTADLAPAAQTDRRVLDCMGAMKNIALALNQHVIHDELTDELTKLTAERFLDGLLSYRDLLPAKTVVRLQNDRNQIDVASLKKEMRAGSCAYFDERAKFLQESVEEAKTNFNSVPVLSAINKQGKKNAATIFRTRRYYHRLMKLERSLRGLGADPMLRAFMGALDPYSSYRDVEETEIFQKLLLGTTYSGIGVNLEEPNEHGVRISKILEDGPAEKSGLLAEGDIITAVEGQSIIGFDLDDLHPMLTGLDGSRVKLRIGQLKGRNLVNLKTIVVTRGQVKRSSTAISVSRRTVDGRNIVTLRLTRFYGQCAEDVQGELTKMVEELKPAGGIHALILDLRGNRGGRIEEAQRLVGLFIDKGPVYGVKLKRHELRDDDANLTKYEGALLVAVDSDTASAAEIVAGALKDYRRALIIGDPMTYGKGTMQSVVREGQGVRSGSLTVTTGRYYTAGGRAVQREGVQSDIVIAGPRATKIAREATLPNTIAHVVYPALLEDEQLAANSSAVLAVALPVLELQASLRAMEVQPSAADASSNTGDRQLREIEQVASDYAALHREQ